MERVHGSQGHEEHYVDGYIEAAIELTTAILDKRLYGQRDTLVLPILYSARHAVQLNLKFAASRLRQACHRNEHIPRAFARDRAAAQKTLTRSARTRALKAGARERPR